MKGSKVTNEFLKRMNIETSDSAIDLNKIVRKMLTNYVDILFKERFSDKYELLCCLDTNGRFIYICPNHINVMGFYPEELCGMNGFEIIHPEDVNRMNEFLIEMLNSKQPKVVIYRINHKLGHWLTMKSICTPYIIDGEVAAMINFSNRCY
ncbi:PAS domain-containing protein [Brevibacillus massiliensis]|uniref:PAS domain-containing protein n=2 Tax=Brevibacillus massiliensis TaxID=1118054 RepID=UPI00036347CF|nr:PAS domain-containing protein [Brevibacillus massiliensis]